MSSVDAESDALHARARAFVRAFEADQESPEPFDALAADLARFQVARVEGYARLCRAHGVAPAEIARAADAPAVPTDAFKATRVATFPDGDAGRRFRTSGTTVGARGVHEMRTTDTYDLGALAFGRRMLARDWELPVTVLALAPSPRELPDSSLVHMLETFARAWSAPERVFYIEDDIIDLAALDERIARALAVDDRVLLCGTSFAFVHFLDGMGDALFRLPAGSRIMLTGGFKGKSREVDADALRREISRVFCVSPSAVIGEYGMTELSSQFYEQAPGLFVEPPWARVVPVDPDTLAPVPHGQAGIARIEDLLNVDSAFAILAADRVRRVEGGFELLGRAPGAPPRGCSIAVDEILGRA
jgi:hypothetical protein